MRNFGDLNRITAMSDLQKFVDEISEAERVHPRAAKFAIDRNNLLAAKAFVRAHLAGSSRGGVAARGKSGRKVRDRSDAGKANRERVARYRAKRGSPESID